jgi:acetolactate synthase-1/2/3 large subunit
MAQMTGGEAVVQTLRHEGVEVVFGMPGVQVMSIYDAFYGQAGIQVMTVRHEQTTAYMADGYARVTGKPGVALVVPGPGVQNASAALGTAYAASSPVLLLAGQVESFNVGQDRGALHEINDQQDTIRPVTKWCQRAHTVPEIAPAIQEAMRQMRHGRPRPTEVEVAPDVRGGIVAWRPQTLDLGWRWCRNRRSRARARGLSRSSGRPGCDHE